MEQGNTKKVSPVSTHVSSGLSWQRKTQAPDLLRTILSGDEQNKAMMGRTYCMNGIYEKCVPMPIVNLKHGLQEDMIRLKRILNTWGKDMEGI